MKIFHNKGKYGIVMMVIIALMLQIAGPIVSEYVYATGDEEVEVEETVVDEKENAEGKEQVTTDKSEDVLDDEGETDPITEREILSEKKEENKNQQEGKKPEEDRVSMNSGTYSTNKVALDGNHSIGDAEDVNQQKMEEEKKDSDTGRNLAPFEEFKYKVNLYVDGKEVDDGSSISIENITTLEYGVTFEISDGFSFNNGDYLNLDVSTLLNLPGFDISDKSGRVIFKIKNSEDIDAASYTIEDGELKITFDNGEGLNDINERIGYANLIVNITEISEEVNVVEEIKLVGKEEKTFTIIRKKDIGKSLSKKGRYIESEDKIEWIIDVNTSLDILKSAKIVDIIPESLTVEKVEVIDLKVTTKEEKVILTQDGEWIDKTLEGLKGNKVELELGNLNRKAKRIKVTTSIVDDSLIGVASIENKAILESENIKYIEAPFTLEFKRITGISKSGDWLKNSNIIEWKIEFRGDSNQGVSKIVDELTLPEDIKLVLDKSSVKLGNNEIEKENIEIDGNKIEFKNIPNSTDVQILTYETEAIFEGSGEGKYTIENNASGKATLF